MPVLVSLEKLVALDESRPLWPAAFEGLIAKLEEEPNAKAQWGIIADWLDEVEIGEHELAEAFRWVSKRPVAVSMGANTWDSDRWELKNLPHKIAMAFYDVKGCDCRTLPSLAAKLVGAIRILKEELF